MNLNEHKAVEPTIPMMQAIERQNKRINLRNENTVLKKQLIESEARAVELREYVKWLIQDFETNEPSESIDRAKDAIDNKYGQKLVARLEDMGLIFEYLKTIKLDCEVCQFEEGNLKETDLYDTVNKAIAVYKRNASSNEEVK